MSKRFLSALLSAVILTAALATGLLYAADNAASDAFYQETGPHNPDILVIGIDQETVDRLGSIYGMRGSMADAIDRLNADPENRPAVIGIDIMYTGRNLDAPQADQRLAEAAGRCGNIVVAADAEFGVQLVTKGSSSSPNLQTGVLGWYEPYEALKEAAFYGHINQMLDRDGIFRHALQQIEVPEFGTAKSFARVIYERWCAFCNVIPNPEPSTSADGFYYLPFSAASGGYSDGFSFLDLLEGNIDPYYYRGKIVLIGPIAPGMQDAYFTSLDHTVAMPGVEIQANVIEAYQNGFFPRETSRSIQLTVAFLFCFAAAFLFWNQKPACSAVSWLAVCAGWLGICRLLYDYAAVILHVLWIPACVSILFFASLAGNFMRAQREKRRITDTFGHYIDPGVMNRLLAEGKSALALGGKTTNIAVLFVDVRGFTAMSEALDAQTVVEIINRYLTLTTDCIMKNHGSLECARCAGGSCLSCLQGCSGYGRGFRRTE